MFNSFERNQRRSDTRRSDLSFLTFVSFQALKSKTHVTFFSLQPLRTQWTLKFKKTKLVYPIKKFLIYFYKKILYSHLIPIKKFKYTYIRTTFSFGTNRASFTLRPRCSRRPSYSIKTRLSFVTLRKVSRKCRLTFVSFWTWKTSNTSRSWFSRDTMTSRCTLIILI